MDINNIIVCVLLAVFTDGIQCEIFIARFVVFYVEWLEIVKRSTCFFHKFVFERVTNGVVEELDGLVFL